MLGQQVSPANQIADYLLQVLGIHAILLHGIAVADGYGIILKALMVDSYAKRRAYGVLPPVTFTNGVFFFVLQVKIYL
jgi:hypothetical protein